MTDDDVIPLHEWLDHMKDVTDEMARGPLRFTSAAGARVKEPPGERPGSYIAVLSAFNSMHLGVTSSAAGCRALARALIGAEREQEMSDAEVMDGINEFVNIVAGKVKARLQGRDGTLRLGLPHFLTTPVRITDSMERATDRVRVGPVECQLLVFRNKRAA